MRSPSEPPLESRIASALAATDIVSNDLAALISETEAAIEQADKIAEQERTKALDPLLSPDPKAARAAIADWVVLSSILKIRP